MQARNNNEYFQHQPAEYKKDPINNITVTDDNRETTQVDDGDDNIQVQQSNMMTNEHSKQASTITGMSNEPFGNIKADAFCEILGQEIDRVRSESIMQVNTMRRQYEMELQALR